MPGVAEANDCLDFVPVDASTPSMNVCQLWRSRSMSKWNTTTVWCDDVYCDLLLTSDSTPAQTKENTVDSWCSIQWLWIGYLCTLAFMCTCELELSGQNISTRSQDKRILPIFLTVVSLTAVTLVAVVPAAALCLSVTGRSTEKSRQPIYKVGTDTLHHSPRVVQFWHRSLITIFGEGADWLHLLDASKYWQPLWSANPNLNSTCW